MDSRDSTKKGIFLRFYRANGLYHQGLRRSNSDMFLEAGDLQDHTEFMVLAAQYHPLPIILCQLSWVLATLFFLGKRVAKSSV